MTSQGYRGVITKNFRQTPSFKRLAISLNNQECPSLSGLIPTALSLFLGNYHQEYLIQNSTHYQNLIYLASTDSDALEIYETLLFFFPSLKEDIHLYPSLSELPGKLTPLPIEECHIRHTLIHNLVDPSKKDQHHLIITSMKAALEKIPSPTSQRKKLIKKIQVEDTQSLVSWGETLQEIGYRRSHEIASPGEYVIKSGILDIFTPNEKYPHRIYFWDEEVEMIKPFHPYTQKLLPVTETTITSLALPSPHLNDYHHHIDKESITKIFSKQLFKSEQNEMINRWQGHQEFSWALLEPFLDNAQWGWTSLLGVTPCPLIFVKKESLSSEASDYQNFIKPYRLYREWDKKSLFAAPEKRFYSPETLIDYPHVSMLRHPHYHTTQKHIHFPTKRAMGFKKDVDKCREYLRQESETKKVFIFTSNPVSGKKWIDFFHQLNPILIEGEETIEKPNDTDSKLIIVCHPLTEGLDYGEQLLITDFELFRKKPKVTLKEQGLTEILEYFTDLKEGDYVVHINQGIGRYLGLERIKGQNTEKDYLKIAYGGGDKLFIPVEQMNLVQRYIGNRGQTPRLNHLGSKSWDRVKQRVKKKLEVLTKKLITLYRERMHHKKIPCNRDDYLQELFESAFPFQETEDQLRTTEEIKQDLESELVMDRLLCGDVGFGKTEVAMRAIFKVVFSGRQAVVMVPTTILSLQHHQRFEERFQDFPITIRVLNRFKDHSERKSILKEVAYGKIEILIGTHSLLSEKIEFKKLGLLVIDEEQKFGVKQKEKIKQNYPHVDTLSLSATPIPRTLHLSLSSIRSLSILNTPPQNRYAIKTYILKWDMLIIKEAVKREIDRGGQIFFVHNQVSTLASVAATLTKEMPTVKICMAHGQMPGRDLEVVMDDFVHHRFDMLVSTSIIESGMDISKVNTLMVNNSNFFGLTQLYQLRGRVGRSNLEAYAYFFLPIDQPISEDAMKRLDALTAHSELGSGFKIAMSDLEIRGPGNILGAEQSGNIMAIGFELYTRLLNESIGESSRNEGNHLEPKNLFLGTLLDLKYEGFIPHHYIPEDRQKIAVYKKIAAIETIERIEQVKKEIESHYGQSPPIINHLLQIANIRIYANQIRLFSIREKEEHYEITLFKESKVNRELLLKLVMNKTLEIDPEKPELFLISTMDKRRGKILPFELRIKTLQDLLLKLSKN